MPRMSVRIAVVAIAGTAAVLPAVTMAAAASGATVPQGLTVATVVPDAPYVLRSGNSLTGFDIQMVQAAAKAAGVQQVRWTRLRTFPEFLPLVSSGAVDMGASNVTITAARKKIVDFGNPYESTPEGLLTRRDSGITWPAGLAGHAVGAVADTTAVSRARSVPGATVRIYPTTLAMLAGLGASEVDGAIGDASTLTWRAREFAWAGAVQPIPTGQVGALVFPRTARGRAARTAMNRGLGVIERNGTLARLQRRWGVSPAPQ